MSANDIANLATAGNVLSLLGCTVIITSYVASRRRLAGRGTMVGSGHVSVHHKAMLFMALTNVLLNIGGLTYNALDFSGSRAVCVLQALHITYFNLSNWLWTVCIAFNIVLILQRRELYPQHLTKVFCAICWAVPGFLVLPVLSTREQNIANVGPWCWIPASNPKLRYGVFYGWLLMTYFANLGILIAIVVGTYKQRRKWQSSGAGQHSSNQNRDQQAKLPPNTSPAVARTAPLSGVESEGNGNDIGGAGAGAGVRSPSVSSAPQQTQQRRKKDPYSTLVCRYVMYVFVILFSWIFGIALRFGQVADPKFSNPTLATLHTFFSISQMFWLSIVLVLSSELQRITDRFFAARSASERARRPSTEPLNADRRASNFHDIPFKPAKPGGNGNSPAAGTARTIQKSVSTKEFKEKPFQPLSFEQGDDDNV